MQGFAQFGTTAGTTGLRVGLASEIRCGLGEQNLVRIAQLIDEFEALPRSLWNVIAFAEPPDA